MTYNYATINMSRLDNSQGMFDADLPLIGFTDVTGVCPSEPTTCTGNASATLGIEEYTYRDTVHVPFDVVSGGVIFYWSSCCYPSSISTLATTNIFNYSVAYYNSNVYNNKTPTFDDAPINYICIGNQVNYGNGVKDKENDEIIFSLVNCPNNHSYVSSDFYIVPTYYNPGFSGTQPFTSQNPITIDSETGMISFTPTIIENGPLCVMVEEYRNGVKISEKIRSTLLNIQSCSNPNPSISGFNGTASASSVTGMTTMTNLNIGQQVCFDIQAYDIGQNVTLSHSDNLTGATYTVSNAGNNPTLNVCWTPTIDDAGITIFSVIAEDDNCPTLGKSIQTYKFSVNAPFTIQGRVFQPDGSLVSDAAIQLYDTTRTLIGLENTVNGFYRFVFPNNNQLNQSYYVAATPDASLNTLDKTYFGDVPVPQYSTAIPLYTNRTNVANINALEEVTTSGNGQISGIVKSANTGNIIPDARLVLVNNNGDYIKDVIADQNGMAQFDNLASTTYPIWVDAFGINNDIAPPIDIALTPIHDNVDFLLHDTYLELSYPTNTTTKTFIDQVQISPNPTNGLLNLTFPITTTQIQILDINGRMIQQENLNNKIFTTLDLSDLPNQVYLIRVVSEEGVVTNRIVKQ